MPKGVISTHQLGRHRRISLGVKAILISNRLDDVGQLPILMNVQAFDGGLQKLPFLVEWDTMK